MATLGDQTKHKRRRLRTRAYLVTYREEHPCVCGETDVAALDLHHKDPNEKVNQARYLYSMTQLLSEVAKCVVICANCHRKGHAGRPRPEHVSFFTP